MITIAVEEVQQNTICVTLRDPDGVPFLTSSHDVNSVTPKHSHSSLSCVSSNSVPTLSSTSSPARSQLVSLPKNNIPPGVYTFLLQHNLTIVVENCFPVSVLRFYKESSFVCSI